VSASAVEFCSPPLIIFPQYRRTPLSAVFIFDFEKFELVACYTSRSLRYRQTSPDRGQNTGVLIRDERGSQRFSLRSARGSASAQLKIRRTPSRASALMTAALQRSYRQVSMVTDPENNVLIRRTDSPPSLTRAQAPAGKKFLSPLTRKWRCCLIFWVPARYAG
jgi:hypothetical protein